MARKLELEDVATLPRPGCSFPSSFSFSPSSATLTFLASKKESLDRALWGVDLATGVQDLLVEMEQGEQAFSAEEKLRRERARQMHTGITTYQYAQARDRLMVVCNGELFLQNGTDKSSLSLLFPLSALHNEGPHANDGPDAEGDSLIDPKLSADASLASFVWKSELYVVRCDEKGSVPQRVTFGARGHRGVSNALADYLAQEEMDRYTGYWLSEDASQVVFENVDETHIPAFSIMHSGLQQLNTPSHHEVHNYPFAGQANPKVRLGVTPTTGSGHVVWLDVDACCGTDWYVPRVSWFAGFVIVQVQQRSQQQLDVVMFNASTGQGTVVFTERSATWINIHDLFFPLSVAVANNGVPSLSFLWGSEARDLMGEATNPDERCRLVRVEAGRVVAVLTPEHTVEAISAVDTAHNALFFLGWHTDPLERHLYAAPLTGAGGEGASVRQVTREPGMHSCVVSPCRTMVVDQYSSLRQPFAVNLVSMADGKVMRTLHTPADSRLPPAMSPSMPPAPASSPTHLAFVEPSVFSFTADDGRTLYGAVCLPPAERFGKGPFPTMVFVYGGPHVQLVNNSWTLISDMRMQFYAQNGVAVLKVDNRGSSRRGRAFEAPLHRSMGSVEVDDQVAGVRHCVEQGLVDGERVGICGWSYGGYMAAMCLAKRPDVFKLAISGAPVTHWAGYDTHYTERYMGTPQNNADGYKVSSVMHHVGTLQGHLLLIHGLLDENVHFRHTTMLIDALVERQKEYELLVFPNARHGPRSVSDRVYLERRCFDAVRRVLAL